MKLDGLIPVYKGMKAQNIERYRFRYKHNSVIFDVFFIIDENPFKLLFGVVGDNFAFDLAVEKGFQINPIVPNKTYSGLCTVLGIKYNPNNRFSTLAFFQEFNRNIPNRVDKKQKAKAYQLARFYPNVEEADKIYFVRWLNHDGIKSNVSPENLEKTKHLLGYKYYEYCSSRNISSCWTDNPTKAKNCYVPG